MCNLTTVLVDRVHEYAPPRRDQASGSGRVATEAVICDNNNNNDNNDNNDIEMYSRGRGGILAAHSIKLDK